MAFVDPPPTPPVPSHTPTPAVPNGHAGHRRFWRPGVLLCGLAIAAAVAGIVNGMLVDERRAQDEATRQSLSAGLQSHIDGKLGFVRFMRGLYDSSDYVSADEFKRFAQIDPAVHDGKSWFSLAWARRESSYPQNRPRDRLGQSGFAAGVAFPVTYLEPIEASRPVIGDAAAIPADRGAMRRAAVLRQMTISDPYPRAGHGGSEIKAYMPVFKNGDAASGNLQGFLIATIAVDGLFDDFLQNAFTDPDFALRVYDGQTLVYSRGPDDAPRRMTALAVGNQQWRLEIGRAGQAIAPSFWLPALVFVIGLALTGMLYLHLLRIDSEYVRISREVGRATADLAGANTSLAERSGMLQRVADDLRRTSQEAQLASSAKTVFLANMSHELRTPLNAIIGFAGLIAHRTLGQDSPRYSEYARDIEASGRYLLSIIEDLLDMSRIELGQVRLVEEPVDLEEMVSGVIKFVSHRAHERRIAIKLEGFSAVPRILLDSRSMRQALINLLINAIKFSPPNSTIMVFAEVDGGGGLVLSVQDSGPGIKSEEMARIFEPFWQGEAYRRKARDGVGLGLAITKRLIEAHGGTVELVSGQGKGTRAVIRLPAARVLPSRPQLSVISGGGSAA
jgi:signal transduction histidine kinase